MNAVPAPRGFWHRLDAALERLRPHRVAFSLVVDALVVVACWNATYLFRLGFERWLSARPGYDGFVLMGVAALYVVAITWARLPTSLWRWFGFADVTRLAAACALAGLLAAAVVMGLGLRKVPRAVLALHPIVTFMGLCGVRIGYRVLAEHARVRLTGSQQESRRAIVLGAGTAGRMLLAGIAQQGWTVLGLLDDDPAKRGMRIGAARVLGTIDALRDARVRGNATHVVVAMPGARLEERRRALAVAADSGLRVLTVPTVDELREGTSRIERLRDIEPEDLLGREPVVLDEAGIGELLAGRTVLVTGAGGSIGSELCRQIARYRPARLVLFEQSEFNLYALEQELGQTHPECALVRLIGDVRERAQLDAAFARWRPAVVFHAAAYKHVPLMEEDNAWAALRNNTWGTWQAAEAAAAAGVERFVLISTDKAVNPTNVMGATKRAAELALLELAARHAGTRFMAVRFGNVLGSSGSVIPKFKEQIARGGPVTVTHPEIIRYFMTIAEAARLVLQAAAIGESGQVLVLDMGEPVRIVDLARDLIRMAGHTVDEIGIVFSGLRPGEKLYEELLADADATVPTPVARLRVARLGGPARAVAPLLALAQAGAPLADAAVRAALAEVLPEYRPAPDGAARAATGNAHERIAS